MLRAVAIASAIVAAYCVLSWWQSALVLADGTMLENGAGATVASLNADIEGFRGDPSSAGTLTTSLEGVRSQLDGQLSAVATSRSMYLPPAGRVQHEYEDNLKEYIHSIEVYYDDLLMEAEFVIERARVVADLGEGLDVLQGLSAPDVTKEEIDRILEGAGKTVDQAATRLESLTASVTVVYSSQDLLERLDIVSGALASIQDGLEREDADGVTASVQRFSDALGADWSSLFFAADEAGLERMASASDELAAQRTEVSEARADLASARNAAGFAALAFALIAALSGAAAWAR